MNAIAYINALAELIRAELKAEGGCALPVFPEIAPPHNTPDRIRCWADSCEAIIPRQFNYKFTVTVCAELDGAAHDEQKAAAMFTHAMGAVQRAFDRHTKGAELDAYGCAATVIDCYAEPQPIQFDDGRRRCVVSARVYLQF